MTAPEAPIGVLLFNLGGPDDLESVEPFLINLFSDRDIIELPLGRLVQPLFARLVAKVRGPSVRRNYGLIGGGSPQLRITRAQAEALEARLNAGPSRAPGASATGVEASALEIAKAFGTYKGRPHGTAGSASASDASHRSAPTLSGGSSSSAPATEEKAGQSGQPSCSDPTASAQRLSPSGAVSLTPASPVPAAADPLAPTSASSPDANA